MSKKFPEVQKYAGYEILIEIGKHPGFDSETLSQQFQYSLEDYFTLHGLFDLAQIVNVPTDKVHTDVRFAGEEERNETNIIKIKSSEIDESSDPVAEYWFTSIISAIKKAIGSLNVSTEFFVEDSDDFQTTTIVQGENKRRQCKTIKSKRVRLVFRVGP